MKDNDPFIMNKGDVRKKIKRRLREQAPEVRDRRNRIIRDKFFDDIKFRKCSFVMIYVSLLEEVDTIYIIRKALKLGKRVIIPYIQQDNDELEVSEITALESLEKGPYGILQPPWDRIKPVPLQTIELIVVPAIAFDKKNMRLGRGKGYYDRFLSKKAINNAETIGLAFDFQILESLPYDYHDKPVDQVLTN